MARISLAELYELIRSSPSYEDRWRLDVEAEEALVITLGRDQKQAKTTSKSFETADGLILVLDVDDRGRVWQLELM